LYKKLQNENPQKKRVRRGGKVAEEGVEGGGYRKTRLDNY